jgi:hypothetical protein
MRAGNPVEAFVKRNCEVPHLTLPRADGGHCVGAFELRPKFSRFIVTEMPHQAEANCLKDAPTRFFSNDVRLPPERAAHNCASGRMRGLQGNKPARGTIVDGPGQSGWFRLKHLATFDVSFKSGKNSGRGWKDVLLGKFQTSI